VEDRLESGLVHGYLRDETALHHHAPSGRGARQTFSEFLDSGSRWIVPPAELAEEPGARKGPIALGGAAADPTGRGCLLDRQSGEEPELDQRSRLRVDAGETVDGLVQVDHVIGRGIIFENRLQIQFLAPTATASFQSLAVSRPIDED